MGSIFQVSESTGNVTITGSVDVGSHQIHNVSDPTSAQDASTKNYVDTIAQGIAWKASVQAATAAALPTNIYNNGASGVGATLTGVVNGALVVDGYTVVVNDRVLIKNEVTQANNGIYVVTVTGSISAVYVLTRSSDYDTASEVIAGTATFVEQGSTNSDKGFVQTTTGTITIGTTALVFTQFTGLGEVTAGTGLTKTGDTISLITPVAVLNGGTGQTTYTDGQLLIGDSSTNGLDKATLTAGTGISVTNGHGSITIANTGVTSITGTTNQVIASSSTGAVTLSLPQSIATSSTPTFGGLTLSGNEEIQSGHALQLDGATSGNIQIKANDTTTSYSIKMPAAQGGISTVLTNDGSGNLSWGSGSSGSGTVNNGTAGRVSLYATSTNAVSDTYIQNSHNITLAFASQGSRSTDLAITLPNPGNAVSSSNVITDSDTNAYTLSGTYSLSNNLTLASSKEVILTDNTTHTVALKATNSTTSYTLSLPTTAGTANYFLQTDGSGNTSWQPGGSGTILSGTTGQLSYYASGGTTLSGLTSGATNQVLTTPSSSSTPSWMDNFYVNVKAYGAVGNNSTDDTTAIQNAINAVSAAGQGTVFFPAGIYKLTSTLTTAIGVNLVGTYTNGGGGNSELNQTGSVPVLTLHNEAIGGAGTNVQQRIMIQGLNLNGGTNAIYAENGGVGVTIRDVQCSSQSDRCIYLRGFCQEWFLEDVELNSGTYGIYLNATGLQPDHVTTGTPILFDKCHFNSLYCHGQSINGVYVVIPSGTGTFNSFRDVRLISIQQDGMVFNGALNSFDFSGISAESVATGSPTLGLTTATTIATSPTVTVASGTNLVNGQVVTIAGAGTNGQDWYPTISSGGGTTTLTMTTNAPTSVTNAELTNALYSIVKCSGPNAVVKHFNFKTITANGSAIPRYILDLSSAAGVTILGCTVGRPIYDPNVAAVYLNETFDDFIRRPNNYIGENFATPTFGGTNAPRSVVNSPPGGNLTFGLVDTTQNSGGTFGVIDVRTPATTSSTSATQLLKIDSTGKLSFINNAVAGIVGTPTNDNAASGNVGEYVESVFSSVSFPSSTAFGDATSISLTAGDWDVSFNFFTTSTTNTVSSFNAGISTTTGNSTTGLVLGSNYWNTQSPPTTSLNANGSIVSWRRSLSGTTTIYAKFGASYTGTAPQMYGKLSARRMR